MLEREKRWFEKINYRRMAAAAVALIIVLTAVLWSKDQETNIENPANMPTNNTNAPTINSTPKSLMAVPSVVKLYSYLRPNSAGGQREQCEITDAVDKQTSFWIEDGYEYGIRMMFSLPKDYYKDANITFAIYASHGEFRIMDEIQKTENVGKIAQVKENEVLRWDPKDDLKNLKTECNPGDIYFHVLIYADDHLVGFGLVELGCHYLFLDYTVSFYAITLRRFRTVCYPMVDGQYQPVTEAYVWDEITKYEQAMRKEMEQLRVNQSTEGKARESDGMG